MPGALHDLLARPDRERVAVICGDLDDFRRVNSALGHEAGDDLLVTLAGRLQRELPVGCTAARLGADEFVVVSGDSADAGGPEALASTVAGLLRTTLTVRGRPVQLTASVGVAVPPEGGDVAAADLLRFAEVAMHDAKRSSRGGVALATDGVVGSATRDLELEAELRAAIAADTLVLEYQPVVGPDGLVCTAEALVRWPHPEHGVIPPGEFLPIAQRGGLLRELDDWVLRTACREAAGWPEHGGRPVAVAVNLAGLLPSDPEFRATVTDIVESAGLPWDRLVLEVVETSLVALPAHALAAMDRLVQRGVRFAIDDFGTGYSSLARLKELPAQIVKVDRAFVRGVATDPADFAVARAVVDMAKAMGRSTVAEGVETTEQYHVLRGVGVDAQQGWLFARSLPPRQLRELLAGGAGRGTGGSGRLTCRRGVSMACTVRASPGGVPRCGNDTGVGVPGAADRVSLSRFPAAGEASSVITGGRPVIEFRGVTKRFPDGTVAVDNLELQVRDGGITVFVGPSGLRQDDVAAHGQPHDRPDVGHDPGQRHGRDDRPTPPSCGGGSATSSSRRGCSRTARSSTTSRRCRCCWAGTRRRPATGRWS